MIVLGLGRVSGITAPFVQMQMQMHDLLKINAGSEIIKHHGFAFALVF